MRRVMNGILVAGAVTALIGLSGCASIESVEHAQATADQALADAGRAQQAALNAQAAADRAMASADRAQQTANAAQSSADRVASSVTQSRSEYTALNQQVESLRPRRGMRD
ncbi:MAG TPA: alanine-zipper protein [Rhizomicrobium sp.]|nr:alanine-zipper protein [Rhizomicrobium sp.]